MKNQNLIVSAILVYGCMISSSFANPPTYDSIKAVITCPVTKGDQANQLRNFANSYIAGNGLENLTLGSGPVSTKMVLFKTQNALPTGITGDLTSYSVSSVAFNIGNATNPSVACLYTSSNTALPAFTVSYALLNGFGAALVSSTTNSVTLDIPVGVRDSSL